MLPTRQPTYIPSKQPNRRPTRQPSRVPSRQPSSSPTLQRLISPSRQPSSQPLRHPSAQPRSRPSRQPTSNPLSPSSKPTAQPILRPVARPTSRPTAVLEVSILVTITQVLRNVSFAQFMASLPSQSSFKLTVISGARVSTALVAIAKVFNNTQGSPIIPFSILSAADAKMLQSRKLADSQNDIALIYSVQCSISALGTSDPQVAYDLLSARLRDFINSGNFTQRLQQHALSTNAKAVLFSSSSAGDIDIQRAFSTILTHTARPTTDPSSHPSSQPSSQPFLYPTITPTISDFSRLFIQLNRELKSLYGSKNPPQNRDIYYEIKSENDTIFGGSISWISFINNYLKKSPASEATVLTSIAANSSEIMTTIQCTDSASVISIVDALMSPPPKDKTIFCNGIKWVVGYCNFNATTSNYPSLCVNCDSLCAKRSCHSTSSMMFPSSSSNCESFQILSIDHISSIKENSDAIIMYSLLWSCVIIAFLLDKWRQRSIKLKDDKKVGQVATHLNESHSLEQQLVEKVDNLFQDILASQDSLLLWGTSRIVYCNRFFHAVSNIGASTTERLNRGIYAITRLGLLTYLLVVFLKIQYPSDNGSCSLQMSRSDCLSIKSHFAFTMNVCSWNNQADLENNKFQANCRWEDQIRYADSSKIMKLVILTLFIFSIIRLLILDAVVERILSSQASKRAYLSFFRQLISLLAPPSKKVISYEGPMPTTSHSHKSPQKWQVNASNAVKPVENLDVTAVLSEQDDGAKYDLEVRDVELKKNAPAVLSQPIRLDRDEEFAGFVETILAHRSTISDPLTLKEFDNYWAIDALLLSFADYKYITRNVHWSIRHQFVLYQNAREYYLELLSETLRVSSILSEYRSSRCDGTIYFASSTSSPDSTLLGAFAVDLVGRFNYEGIIFSAHRERMSRMGVRRITKHGNTQNAVEHVHFVLRDLILIALTIANVLFFYYATVLSSSQSSNWTKVWSNALLSVIIIDVLLFESSELAWFLVAVPLTCKQKVLSAYHTMIDCVKSFVGQSNMAVQEAKFSATDYFFVSSRLARSFPSIESSVVLTYKVKTPLELTASDWIDQKDLDNVPINYRFFVLNVLKFLAVLPDAVQSLIIIGVLLAIMFGCSSDVKGRFSPIGFVIFAACYIFALCSVFALLFIRSRRNVSNHQMVSTGRIASSSTPAQINTTTVANTSSLRAAEFLSPSKEANSGTVVYLNEELKIETLQDLNDSPQRHDRRRSTNPFRAVDLFELSSNSESDLENERMLNDFEIDVVVQERLSTPDKESQEVFEDSDYSNNRRRNSRRGSPHWLYDEELSLPMVYSTVSDTIVDSIPMPSRSANHFDESIDALYEHVQANFDSIRSNLMRSTNNNQESMRVEDATFLSYSDSEEGSSEPSSIHLQTDSDDDI
eukprot:CAMPEP_0170102794 /NCGR_PEP_ID=MMETSP0020_2-20130122/3093_1 /TAXON_ID=98059 /ORGANISM="Dinobryon sp., Strain UTEXLB2267" /LENGTH=1401 /DNA_ID=CAMNT_0010326203 /DNA_START=3236 /DNA_END=7441 /DNA_ORIENTATION=-